MKKFVIVLVLALLCGMYSCTYKTGQIVGLPTDKQMTEKEKEFQKNLFDGDIFVQVRLNNGDTVNAVITEKRWKENNPAVEVSSDFNNGTYLVK